MKVIFRFPAWMFVMLSITLLHLTARGQTVDLLDLRPSYSASATPNVYNSNIVVDATASQAGTVYYVIYRNKPATTPSSSLIVQYVDGTVTPPASVKAKGTISAPTAGQKYSVTVSAMTPHKNYYAYAVLKNSSGTVGTTVKSAADIRLMEAKYVANNYFYAEYNSHEYLTSTAKYPLMVFLHGNNEKGTTVEELIEPTKYGPPKHVQECDTTTTTIPELTKFIIVTPQSDTDFYVDGTGWSSSKLTTFVNAVMNGNSRIDRNRIYITGLSMGGIGTFRYAIANPTIPAAIVPISGDGDDSKACTIAHIPMWLFHDDPDDVVSVSHSKSMFNAVKACSTYTDNANLTLRRSFNKSWACAVDSMHSVWGTAYGTSHQTPYPDVTCVAGASGTSGRDITETHSNMPSGSTVYKWLLQFSKGPTANAGADKSITLPTSTVNITGTGSPAGVTFAWSQTDGPNTAQLSNQNTATVTASNLIAGTYTFLLTVTDPATSSSDDDEVLVTVEPAPGGDRVIKVDFRGGPPVTGNAAWNDFLDGADAGDVFSNLKDDQGVATGYSITVVDGFQGTNANGSTSTTGVYPASVMQTAWYTSTTAAKLTISGLNNSKKYTLRFFGSRVDNSSSTQRNTDYTIVGGSVVTLNALNNSLNTVQVTDISPTSQSITFTVKGAVGANGGFGYLNAMEIIEQADVPESQTFQIDLRGSGSAADPAWHDFAAFPSAGAELLNLKNTEGVSSTYKLTVASNAFTNSNANGSTSGSGIYPATVMQTAWYTASTTVGASMTLSGLDNAKKYTFVFFGSRNDATTTNRDTYYTIGSTTTPPLNASNNSLNTVSIDDVSPTNGSITFNVKAGPQASGGFGYLNALVIIENSSSSSSFMAQSGESQIADEKEPVDIYPAPFTNRLTVAFTEDLPGHVSVTIKDIRGQVYYHSRNLEGAAGSKIEIETEGSRIPRGLTIVEVKSSGGYHKTFKVFKE